MIAHGVKPIGLTFVIVLSACSHAGFVDEGRKQFSSTTQLYGIEPDVLHCTCIVFVGRQDVWSSRALHSQHAC